MGLPRFVFIFYGGIFGSMLIFSIALLSTHTVFMQMVKQRQGQLPSSGLIQTECTIHNHTIVYDSSRQWRAVWTVLRPGPLAYTIGESSPFNERSSEELARRDLLVWPLNITVPCVCSTTLCLFELSIVKYLEQEGARYRYANATLVGVGIVSLLAALAGLAVLLWDTACCNSMRKRVGLDGHDFYTLTDQE